MVFKPTSNPSFAGTANITINETAVAVNTSDTVTKVASTINGLSIPGVTAAAVDGRLEIYSDGNSLSCSATDGATPGTFTSILRTFSGSCAVGAGGFTGSATHSFTSGDSISAWLLDTNNEIANSCTEAAAKVTIFGVQTFATPVVVSELTSGFNMAFGVSSGSSMFQNGEGGSHSVGSGPFKVLITPINY